MSQNEPSAPEVLLLYKICGKITNETVNIERNVLNRKIQRKNLKYKATEAPKFPSIVFKLLYHSSKLYKKFLKLDPN